MPRIAGVDLPQEKRTDIGLTAIYGIGRSNVMRILNSVKVNPATRIKDLTDEEVVKIQKAIEQLPTEGALRKQVTENIKRLKTIGSYRGLRHSQNLPVRGQRTRSNARTKRGKRTTVGAMRKKDLTKLEPRTQEKQETGAKES
jgi:small subunit ribosomal protein S13